MSDVSFEPEQNLGSKSSNGCKKVNEKFNDLFLLIEWFARNFSYLSKILLLDLTEIFDICRNYGIFYISSHFGL